MSGYDVSVSTFSPDGKVFQVEYAGNALKSNPLVCGIVCCDGVVLMTNKWTQSELQIPTNHTKKLGEHVSCAIAGYLPDGRHLAEKAASEVSEYQRVWGHPIDGRALTDRIGLYVHHHTSGWSSRPFGAILVLGMIEGRTPTAAPGTVGINGVRGQTAFNEGTPALYAVDVSGSAFKYRAAAFGQNSAPARSELDRLIGDGSASLTCEQACDELARIIVKYHQESHHELGCNLEAMIITKDGCKRHPDPTTLRDNAIQWLDEQEE